MITVISAEVTSEVILIRCFEIFFILRGASATITKEAIQLGELLNFSASRTSLGCTTATSSGSCPFPALCDTTYSFYKIVIN